MFKGASKRIEREHNDRAWIAWHVATLSRMKKIPKLQTMLIGTQRRARQGWKEQQAVMSAWANVMRKVKGRG